MTWQKNLRVSSMVKQPTSCKQWQLHTVSIAAMQPQDQQIRAFTHSKGIDMHSKSTCMHANMCNSRRRSPGYGEDLWNGTSSGAGGGGGSKLRVRIVVSQRVRLMNSLMTRCRPTPSTICTAKSTNQHSHLHDLLAVHISNVHLVLRPHTHKRPKAQMCTDMT